jgi:hypothetical protein
MVTAGAIAPVNGSTFLSTGALLSVATTLNAYVDRGFVGV